MNPADTTTSAIAEACRYVEEAAYAAEASSAGGELADVERQNALDAIESAQRRLDAARAAILSDHEEATQ